MYPECTHPVLNFALMFVDLNYSKTNFSALYVDPNLPVIEFGGCIGVISCLTNKKIKDKKKHIVVEAQPYLIETLKKNRNNNDCKLVYQLFCMLSRTYFA